MRANMTQPTPDLTCPLPALPEYPNTPGTTTTKKRMVKIYMKKKIMNIVKNSKQCTTLVKIKQNTHKKRTNIMRIKIIYQKPVRIW